MKAIKFRPRRAPAPLESTVQSQIAAWLKIVLPDGWRSSAVPSGGGGRIRGAQLKRMGLVRGLPDLLLLSRWGQFLGLEIKRPGKSSNTSDAQKDWIEWSDGRIGVVTNVEEARAFLIRHGVLKP